MPRATHLHLIREVNPGYVPSGVVSRVYCEECAAPVYVIHLELGPVDPEEG